MKHFVNFINRDNKWDNALPIGNGVFGAMLFYEDGVLQMPMNHYEVYYNTDHNYMPKDLANAARRIDELERKGAPQQPKGFPQAHTDMIRKADGNIPPEGEPFVEYRLSREQATDLTNYAYGVSDVSCHTSTGDLSFTFDGGFADCEQSLVLDVEKAKVTLTLDAGEQHLTLETVTARCDAILQRIRQSEPGLLKTVRLSMPAYRGIDPPNNITFVQADASTFIYTVTRTFTNGSTPFTYSGILRLVGAEGKMTAESDTCTVEITRAENEFHLLTGIFTEFRYPDTVSGGLSEMNLWSRDTDRLWEEHAAYWKAFFEKSSITIPDKFLEHVYYVNQYALDCCSGKDGVLKHQACGLNGLWDIRHPNIWGSSWYWDVNIQASFAGVFSSNRLDLGKVFSDGLRAYRDLARIFARERHNLPGAALDFPYYMYYCIWPWCAQYLWFQYEYSQDKEYLKNEAYPLFLDLCEFAVELFRYDAETDTYTVYPDISPEQGPLTHDTVITIASVKYLLRFTLQAAEILGDASPILEKCRTLLAKLPAYPVSDTGCWGPHLKDSPDAPGNMWLRHPSLLMPIYPVGEFDPLTDDEATRQMILNTLNYVEDQTEIGVFQCSWIAIVAARYGLGHTALRLLYERGIDHMLRSNGLTAEETERFMNYCLLVRQPMWYPCMMEFTGEMLAAVNEMLLQSYNGVIRVFPAVPDKALDWTPALRQGRALLECPDRLTSYEPWEDLRFDRLLAKGAFEISAEIRGGALRFILVHSRVGGTVRLLSPYMSEKLPVWCGGDEIPATMDNGILTFETEAGTDYLIALSPDAYTEENDGDTENRGILMRESHTRRKIFIGENADTEYHKALDHVIRSWYMGNLRLENHTVYKFDFGCCTEDKKYWETLTRQAYVGPERTMRAMKFFPIREDNLAFHPSVGFGFSNTKGIRAVDRGLDDCLRRDFLEGTEPTEFIIEAPRGQYEILVVSGDAAEDSVTILRGNNGYTVGGDVVRAGQYQCELIPMPQKKDVPLRLHVSTVPGKKWKLNLMVMNIHKGY